MAADVSLPSVVLFLEGTGGREVFQKVVSGLQRQGRRVQVFVRAGEPEASSKAGLAPPPAPAGSWHRDRNYRDGR